MKLFNLKICSLFIISFVIIGSLSSCDKSDALTSTAALRTKEIVLNATSGSAVTGKAVIAENADHSFNVQITLQNTVKDTVHVMHIHNGSIAYPGNISIPLTDIKGTGGQATATTLNIKSATTVGGVAKPLTYDSIIIYKGYFNVHYSAAQIDKIVANADIK